MQAETYEKLRQEGIFEYGSNELKVFEKRLEKYFSREYERNKTLPKQAVPLKDGPLPLSPEDLADEHYDHGLEFFQAFLDAGTMSYTMAYYGESAQDALESDKSLEQAQLDKFELIAKRMKLIGNETLINIGCGFGYFESYLLNNYPEIAVTSTTHSKDQYNFILERAKNSNDPLSSERFKILFGDIDSDSPAQWGEKAFDVACSMGLVEQINNIDLFYKIISELLSDDGRMFHHLIVSRDLIPQFLDPTKTLIGDYFPGGKVLPFHALKGDFDHFMLDQAWFINGMNYWRTLDKWHSNFWENLRNIYPSRLNTAHVRYWNNYFVLCKAMFFPENGSAYGNGQYLYYKR